MLRKTEDGALLVQMAREKFPSPTKGSPEAYDAGEYCVVGFPAADEALDVLSSRGVRVWDYWALVRAIRANDQGNFNEAWRLAELALTPERWYEER